MSSLIPDRPLIISPSLAATIGLEEAVLLQVLNDASLFGHSTVDHQGLQWLSISISELQSLLPFWDSRSLQRIYLSLRDKGIILISSDIEAHESKYCFAMNDSPQQNIHPKKSIQKSSQLVSASRSSTRTTGACLIGENWQPDQDLLQILMLNHSIPQEFALAQVEDFVFYWHDRRQVTHSWPNKFRQHVLKEWRFHQSREAELAKTLPITEDGEWNPSHEVMEILQRDNISIEFIEDAIPEFVLYWRERGEASKIWNSKFIAHIRRQWAIYTKTLELDYEPRQISANWQPSEDVYDILRLANIDLDFARDQVAEFVLFWRDTKEIKRSWNTTFLQHAKYKWATRHHMGQHYAGQQIAGGSGQQEAKTTFEHLTDRSWAEGLVGDS